MSESREVQEVEEPRPSAPPKETDGVARPSRLAPQAPAGRAPRWIRRRARNVYRRPLLVGAVALGVFIVVLVTAVIAPLQEQRAVRATLPPVRARPDTAGIRRHIQMADVVRRSTDSALTVARRFVTDSIATSDTARQRDTGRRDSLVAESNALGALLRRAHDAPLAASYRALGSAPALRGERRVRALIDTLSRLDSSRASFGSAGGADPIFVALTTRLTQIGKQLEKAAEARRSAIESELNRMNPVAMPVSRIDTVALARTRDSAVASLASARRWLAEAREVERDMDATQARARAAASIGASVPAMLAGAAALGVAVGFGVALAFEVREPRVSDGDEAEAIAGASVLTTIGEPAAAPVRRRRADLEMPPLIDLGSDAYRLLFAQLADRADNLPLLSIVGDDALTTAVVSANLGAAGARQVREVLIIDTDVERQSLSSVMRVRGTPGLVDVLAGRLEWAAAVRSVVVDRDRTLDILPSGAFGAHEAMDSMAEHVTRLLVHVARRYDCVLLSVPLSRQGELSLTATLAPAVVVVRTARTTTRGLDRLSGLIRAREGQMRGLALWSRGEPMDFPLELAGRNS